jgi:hypothetical protein
MSKIDTSTKAVHEAADFADSEYLSWSEGADILRALAAERDRLREAGKYLLRAFDHINHSQGKEPIVDAYFLVKNTSTISSISDAHAVLKETDHD